MPYVDPDSLEAALIRAFPEYQADRALLGQFTVAGEELKRLRDSLPPVEAVVSKNGPPLLAKSGWRVVVAVADGDKIVGIAAQYGRTERDIIDVLCLSMNVLKKHFVEELGTAAVGLYWEQRHYDPVAPPSLVDTKILVDWVCSFYKLDRRLLAA